MIDPPAQDPAPDPGVRERRTAEAKALADPTRVAIHRHLLLATTPVTIAELVAATGLHHTAVRQHLAKLEAVGLAERHLLPPSGRGRPRLVYRGIEHPGDHPYRLLAGMLADALRTGRTPREVGRAVGARSGPSVGDPLLAVVGEARRLGFDPVVVDAASPAAGSDGGTEIELHACPYLDLATTDPATVCSLHLGLAEGVAATVGGLVVEGLEPALTGGPCRFRVRREPS